MNVNIKKMANLELRFNSYSNAKCFVALLLLLLVALALRAPGYDGRAFWIDEGWRINLIIDPEVWKSYYPIPSLSAALTSPLWLILNRVIFDLLGTSSEVLRLSSLFSGLISVYLAFYIIRIIGGTFSLSLSAGLIFALNSEFIAYSNEFKPYIFEVGIHLFALLIFLKIILNENLSLTKLLFLFTIYSFALLASPTIVFLLPGLIISLLIYYFMYKKNFFDVLILASLLAIFTGFLYFTLWKYGATNDMVYFWRAGFYEKTNESSYFIYIVDQLKGFGVGAFGLLGKKSVPNQMVIIIFGFFLFSIFSYKLILHKFRENTVYKLLGIYYGCFIVTILIINIAGLWPIGLARPNQFIYAHIIIISIIILSFLSINKINNILTIFVCIYLIGNLGAVDLNTLRRLAPPLQQNDLVYKDFLEGGPLLNIIKEQCKKSKVIVFANPGMATALIYLRSKKVENENNLSILNWNCIDIKGIGDAYANIDGFNKIIKTDNPMKYPMWFLHSHIGPEDISIMINQVSQYGSVNHDTRLVGAGYFSVTAE